MSKAESPSGKSTSVCFLTGKQWIWKLCQWCIVSKLCGSVGPFENPGRRRHARSQTRWLYPHAVSDLRIQYISRFSAIWNIMSIPRECARAAHRNGGANTSNKKHRQKFLLAYSSKFRLNCDREKDTIENK